MNLEEGKQPIDNHKTTLLGNIFRGIFYIIAGLVMLGMLCTGIFALIGFAIETLTSCIELWWLVIIIAFIGFLYLVASNQRNKKS